MENQGFNVYNTKDEPLYDKPLNQDEAIAELFRRNNLKPGTKYELEVNSTGVFMRVLKDPSINDWRPWETKLLTNHYINFSR